MIERTVRLASSVYHKINYTNLMEGLAETGSPFGLFWLDKNPRYINYGEGRHISSYGSSVDMVFFRNTWGSYKVMKNGSQIACVEKNGWVAVPHITGWMCRDSSTSEKLLIYGVDMISALAGLYKRPGVVVAGCSHLAKSLQKITKSPVYWNSDVIPGMALVEMLTLVGGVIEEVCGTVRVKRSDLGVMVIPNDRIEPTIEDLNRVVVRIRRRIGGSSY